MKMQKSVVFIKKNFERNTWKMKNIVNLEITVNIQENIEVLCIAYVIWNIMYLNKFLWLFIMDLTMIIILSGRFNRKI